LAHIRALSDADFGNSRVTVDEEATVSQADAGELAVGREIPVFRRATGVLNWARYAAVNGEFGDMHLDDEAGRAMGYPSAFGMGNLQFSYLHAMLEDWIGESGRIVRVSCQFRAANLKNQVVTAHGIITAIRDEGPETIVDLDVWTEAGSGQVLAPGSATVVLPKA
jgi:hypothetical protein